jgi:two-component system chemotaxis response regulator CheY
MAFNEETFFLGRAGASEGLILVVDDEPDTRKIVRMTLEKAGYDIIEAEDGEAAIQRIGEGEVILRLGLVITDVRMPKMNGVELINFLQWQFPGKRIIVLTGFPDIEMATGCGLFGKASRGREVTRSRKKGVWPRRCKSK